MIRSHIRGIPEDSLDQAESMTSSPSKISVLECEHCGKVFISELAHRGHKANCPEREADSPALELLHPADDAE